MPTHPSQPGSLPLLISIGLCALAAHQSLTGHPHTNHVFSLTHTLSHSLQAPPGSEPESVRTNSRDFDIMGGDYIQDDRTRNIPHLSHAHTHTHLPLPEKSDSFSLFFFLAHPPPLKVMTFGSVLKAASQDTLGEMCIFMICITSYFSPPSLNIGV